MRSFRGGEGAKAISSGLRADISMSKFVFLYVDILYVERSREVDAFNIILTRNIETLVDVC